MVPPSPQKTEFPQPKLAQADPSPVSSPLKLYHSTQPSSPLKSLTASPSSPHRGYVSQSPLKNQGPSKLNSGAALNSSPTKPILTPKPSSTADVTVIHQSRERFTKDTTPLQHRDLAGTTGQWSSSSALFFFYIEVYICELMFAYVDLQEGSSHFWSVLEKGARSATRILPPH